MLVSVIRLSVCLLALVCTNHCLAADVSPPEVFLWPDGAPGALGNESADRPSVRVYSPEKAANTGTAIVVCPGGGYGALAIDHEGQQIGEFLRSHGITALVLKYRLGPKYNHPAPLNDVSRAIRYARANAESLKIAPNRIGVMGFSAGGHLASTVSTHYDKGNAASADPIERQSSRPDFSVLCYPVVSFTAPFSHRGSARNLLGENPDPELLKSLSNETQITSDTPPTFIFHTQEDPGVPVQNALVYYAALCEKKVPAELHIFQNGPHGVGLAIGDPELTTWKERLIGWLRTTGLLADVKRATVSGNVNVGKTPLAWGTITFTSDVPGAPVASAIIRHGKFSIPASRGAALGPNRITIKTMGDVQPQPTVRDSAVLSEKVLTIDVTESRNEISLELEAPAP